MFGELFLVGLLKLAFMGLEDIFERKNFEWNLHNLLVHKRRFFGGTSVWNLRFTSTQPRRWKMRVYCEDLFGRVVKTESFMSRRYYRRKTIFKIFIIFFFFGLSEKSSRTLGRNFFGWKKIPSISVSELMTFRLQLQRKLLAEKYFGGEKVFLHQFPTFSSWCLGLWQKTGRVIKSEFYVSRGNFWQETIFEKKKIIIFGNAAEIAGTFNWIFCHGCQIFLPRVQKKKLLREHKLEKKEYSKLFSSLREKVSKFCKSFQQSLQNCVLPIQAINSRKIYSWNVTYLRGF